MGMTDHSFEDHTAALRAAGQPFAIATVVRTVNATSAKPGAKAIVGADGTILDGWVGGACIRAAISKAALAAIADGKPQFISLRPEEILAAEGVSAGEIRDGVKYARNGCPSQGSMDIFLEPVLPKPQLVICGSGPVALALGALAVQFDFDLQIGADQGYDFTATATGPQFIIIATQGKSDEAALRAAILASPKFAAFVGSRRKFNTLAARLRDKGVPAADLAQVKSPAGLDIGAITPDEIALSILSEVILKRRALQRPKGVSDA